MNKRKIKEYIFRFLNLINLFLPQKRVAILLYHNIEDNDVYLTVPLKTFALQMDFLKKNNYRVISLKNLYEKIKAKEDLPKKTVVLTFDDGYKGHLKNAMPILKRFGFPATFYVTTDFSKTELDNSENKPQSLLTKEDILSLNEYELAEIAPHSVSHKELTEILEKEAVREIKESKKEIERLVGEKSFSFAYPRGYYNKKIIRALKEQGIKCGVTINQGLVSLRAKTYELPRNTINGNAGPEEFKGCLSYSSLFFEVLTSIKRFLK